MDTDEVRRIVEKLTYKPGWVLECYPDEGPRGGVIFRFGKDELDSEINDGEATRALMLTTSLSRDELRPLGRDEILQFVFDTVAKRELHEIEEWLRFDGTPLKEPHPAKCHRGILGDGTSLDQPPVPEHCVQSG